MSDPIAGAARRGRRLGRRRCATAGARSRARRSSARRSPSSATTRRTPRCCSRRCVGEQPREVAERLRERLGGTLGATAERIEVAGPGFLNLFLADRWYREGVAAVLAAGDALGARRRARAASASTVEFVSANPTGPLTAAGGRHAAYGDSVARVLELAGHEVEREYYLNDIGGQVRRFAESIAARMTRRRAARGRLRGRLRRGARARARRPGVRPDDLEELERARRRADARDGSRRRWSASASTSTRWYSERSSMSAAARRPRSPSCASAATSTRARARRGCAPPSSATTRTAS